MVNNRSIYNYTFKKPAGNIKDKVGVLFANNVKDACHKLVEKIDPELIEKEHIKEKINLQTLAANNYAILKFDYKDETLEIFVDKKEEKYIR